MEARALEGNESSYVRTGGEARSTLRASLYCAEAEGFEPSGPTTVLAFWRRLPLAARPHLLGFGRFYTPQSARVTDRLACWRSTPPAQRWALTGPNSLTRRLPCVTMGGMAEPRSDLPPYTAFSTFWAFVEELSQRGPLPQVIDRNVFGSRSAASVYELTHALRSLGLIDQDKRPTSRGREFLAAPTPEGLSAILRDRYEYAIALGLDTATGGQLDEVLVKMMGMKEGSATLRKARTFFLQAAEKAGMELGPHLRVSRQRTAVRPVRRSRAAQLTNGERTVKNAESADLLTRYVELLMDKVREQEQPDEDLLNRIERALKVSPPSDASQV